MPILGNIIPPTVDLKGTELILDADADTSITADTDDQIDIKIAGADDFQFTANTFTAQSGSTIAAQALTATTVTASGNVDFNGDLDVDGTTNLDVVDIDGAVDMASTLQVDGAATFTTEITANGGIALGDNDKATFGASDDLEIYHNGTNSVIADVGTGNIEILGNNLRLKNADASNSYLNGDNGGGVTLYYAGSQKLATASGGITVTGEVAATSLDISGDIDVDGTTNLDVVDIDGAVNMATTALVTGVLTTTAATVFNGGFASNAASTISTADNTDTLSLISTDADAAVGPNLRLYRNSSSPADDDFLGTIEFEGRNDNSQDFIATRLFVYSTDVSDGSEDAVFQLSMMKAGSPHLAIEIGPDEFVINQNGLDIDFRVESNTLTHAFFVDAAADMVLVGGGTNTSGGASFKVTKDADGELTIDTTSSASNIVSYDRNGSAYHPLAIYALSTSISNGLTLTDGNLTVASGHGIDFSATADGTGGTSVGELFDDYEEGDWQPIIKDTSTSGTTMVVVADADRCSYTKIGRIVHVQGYFTRSDTQSLTGNMIVTGLPFTTATTLSMGGNYWLDSSTADDWTGPINMGSGGSSHFVMVKSTSSAVATYLTTNLLPNTKHVYFKASYEAAT